MEEIKYVNLNGEEAETTLEVVVEPKNLKKSLLKFAIGAVFTAGTSIIVGAAVNKICPTKGKNIFVKGAIIATTGAISDFIADALTEKVMNDIHEFGEGIKTIGETISGAGEKKAGQNG